MVMTIMPNLLLEMIPIIDATMGLHFSHTALYGLLIEYSF